MNDYSSNLTVPHNFVGAAQRTTRCVSNDFQNVIVCVECDPKLCHARVTSYNLKLEIDLNDSTL